MIVMVIIFVDDRVDLGHWLNYIDVDGITIISMFVVGADGGGGDNENWTRRIMLRIFIANVYYFYYCFSY